MAREEAHVPSVYSGEGIPVGEFNAALDRYLTDGTGETDLFAHEQEAAARVPGDKEVI